VTRRQKYAVLIVLLAVIAVSVGALCWIAGTRDGARWLMETVSRQTGYTITARQIEGRLWGGLRLEGLYLRGPEWQVRAGSVRLRWQPLYLPMGKIAINELFLKDTQIRDNRPVSKAPPELVWPKVTGIPAWFNMRVKTLRIDGLTYRKLNEAPASVTGISARITWQGRLLTVWNLAVNTPSAHVEGALMAGFRRPSLLVKLTCMPAHPMAGLDKLFFSAKLFPGHGAEQVAGPVRAAGMSGKRERLKFTGELGVTRDSVALRRMSLLQPGRRGTIDGAGTLALSTGKPLVRLQFGFADLDLSSELHAATDLSGTLAVEGSPDAYRGNFTFSNKGTGWRTGRFSGSFQGDGKGVRLTDLDGSLLAGVVTGAAEVDWQKGIYLSGVLHGRNINPAMVTPQWSGLVNADLSGSVRWSAKTPLQAELNGRLLESRLRGKALTGEVDASLLGDNLMIRRLGLHGKGFDINAGGELRKRLAFSARIYDLSGLIPDVGGRLRAEGWVRWHEKRPSGSLTGMGRNIRMDGLRIAAADLAVDLSEGAGYPMQFKSGLRGLVYRQFRADTATLAINGSLAGHTIDAAVHSTEFEVRTTLAGGYKAGSWEGSVIRLSGHDTVGPWRMQAPTALHVSTDGVSLARFAIDGGPGEHLEAGGQVALRPLRGFFRTEWRGLNLARFSPLLGNARVAGLSSGTLQSRWPGGDKLLLAGKADASGTVVADGHRIDVRQASLQIDWNDRGMLSVLDLRLADGGMLAGRFSSPQPARMAAPSRGVMEADWQGFDIALLHPWLPKGFDLEGRLAGRIKGTLMPGMRLDIRGNTAVSQGAVRWREKGNQFTATVHTAGVSWKWQGAKKNAGPFTGTFKTSRLSLNGRIEVSGTAVLDGHSITVQQASLRMDWSERDMHNALDVSLADGGRLRASFSSPLPADLSAPWQGAIDADWEGLDIALLHPWLPDGFDLEGRLAGQVKGNLLPDNRLDIKGKSAISRGAVSWSKEGSQFSAKLNTADISWIWQGEKLNGAVSVALAEYGQVSGNFQLPLPAHLPATFDQRGPVMLSAAGRVREMGLLTSLFPGLIQESSGEIDFEALVGGQWQKPDVTGKLTLAKAAAYLPTAGAQLKNVQLTAHLDHDRLIIDSFRVDSGPGHIDGNAVARLSDWRVVGYEGNIKGDRFQIVYLPELQVLTSPNLNFSGSPDKLSVRGEILVPELLVNEKSGRAPVQPSKDVIVEGEAGPAEKEFALPLDIQVNVVLGDKILVKAQGIDAQLKGRLKLLIRKLDEIRSTGEIRVVKGSYRTYGINLDITRGRIFYAGGPIGQPTLDIQALRKVDDVRAGVIIAGTPRTMTIKLYSEPNMPDSQILSYIVLGQPLAYTQEQSGLITRAGGSLLSTSTGYRPIQTAAPPGAAAKTVGGTLPQSMVSVGRYLTPNLYVSYGRSLLTGNNLFRVRYSLSKHWEVETQTGNESGGDIFYKINFK
jgi:translocation and assembly module TamB